MDTKDILTVRIVSPKETLYNGPAIAVSSVNSAGRFDILAQHANFITIVRDNPIIVLTPDNKRIEFKLALSIIYTTSGQVNIYTDILPK